MIRWLVLLMSVPFVTYGAMWLTVRCAEDARAIVNHVKGKP